MLKTTGFIAALIVIVTTIVFNAEIHDAIAVTYCEIRHGETIEHAILQNTNDINEIPVAKCVRRVLKMQPSS